VEPKARVPAVPPDGAHLSFLVPAPDIAHAAGELVSKYGARLRPHVGVARGEDDFVGFDLGSVGKPYAVWQDGGHLLSLFDLNLAIDNELRSANVDVVPSATLEVFHEEAGRVGPVVELKAGTGEAREEVGVEVALEGGKVKLDGFKNLAWPTPGDWRVF